MTAKREMNDKSRDPSRMPRQKRNYRTLLYSSIPRHYGSFILDIISTDANHYQTTATKLNSPASAEVQ